MVQVLNDTIPGWPEKSILEFAPHGAVSELLESRCKSYTASVYQPDKPMGTTVDGHLNEDLRSLSLPAESYDILVSQDVLEHVFEPEKAIAEIERILKPGGVHIFTIPYLPQIPTRPRAKLEAGSVLHLLEPEYHGDPVSSSGSLVVTDWGNDTATLIDDISGMQTTVHCLQDASRGIVGEHLEVLVSFKSAAGD